MAIVIGADKATRIARLFHLLWQGECIARDAAGVQARICRDPKVRRFFALQAGQEALHATVFHGAATLLARRGCSLRTPAIAVLDDYRRRLDDDLAAGDLAGSVVGLQVVLEGLGDVVLKRLNPELNGHGARFAPWQKMLLAQEDTHHAFGCRWVEHSPSDELPGLAATACGYRDLATRVLNASEELFGYGISTAESYGERLRATLPAALTAEQP